MTHLGKYELLEPLGSGATAEVYRACDAVLGRDVALKVLKPALVADPSAFERFIKEAQAAAGLFHNNIATVLDMGEANGRYFIAMRYIPGQSLDKVLAEKGPLSWDETLRMATQIGSALDFAHKDGFLHRDVKPSNIILTPDGNFVLTDFGLMRAMMSTELTSHTGAILGTPSYIPPEVWEGRPAGVGTDQYALACVVYVCLTGQALFDGETPPSVMKHHFDGWKAPSQWPMGVPAGIDAVLTKALAQTPPDRYPSAAVFSQALKALNIAIPSETKAATPSDEAPAPVHVETALPASPVQSQQTVKASPRLIGWGSVVWIAIGWSIGWAIAIGWSIALNGAIGQMIALAIFGAIGGAITGVVLRIQGAISKIASVSWLSISWAICFAIAAALADVIFDVVGGAIAIAIIFAIAGAIGGIITSIVLRNQCAISKVSSFLWVTIGWVISFTIPSPFINVISMAINNIIFSVIASSILMAIGGTIGGSVMVWQIRLEQKIRALQQGSNL